MVTIKRKTTRGRGRPKGSGGLMVYEEIRNQILTLSLKPGTDIDELTLVKMFSLSRTPVREALIKLEADGLVQIVANRGARVAALDFNNIGKLFEALDLYSRAICRLAALRRDTSAIAGAKKASDDFAHAAREKNYREMGEANWRFHLELGRASGNVYLTDAQTRILSETRRLAYLVHYESGRRQEDQERYFAQLVEEHEQMIEYIEMGDAEQAERLSGRHTRLFQEKLARQILLNDLSSLRVNETEVKIVINSP